MSTPIFDPSNVAETFNAEKVMVYAQQALSDYPGLAANLKVRSLHSAAIDSLVLTMTSWCCSGRIPSRSEDEIVRWPDGAWQFFKRDHLPKFIQRWLSPIRYAEKKVEKATHHYFVCPHLVTDKNSVHIKFMATGTPMAGRIR